MPESKDPQIRIKHMIQLERRRAQEVGLPEPSAIYLDPDFFAAVCRSFAVEPRPNLQGLKIYNMEVRRFQFVESIGNGETWTISSIFSMS